jgi:3-dehydrotetronate 4-kinase
VLIGAVADDITGATDLCLMLSRAGMSVVQVMGVPDAGHLPETDAVVIALKSRTIPAAQAVAMSVSAAQSLLNAGAAQILLKYCSTFDSTDQGNIGPVTEALMDLTGADLTIACPAYPGNGRTVYQGHLFVGGQLLSDSPMKDHPLTPMRDANLVRVLARQTKSRIGLVDAKTVAAGVGAVRTAFDHARKEGIRILIADAISDADLMILGAACADLPIVTGGSGIGTGLAANFMNKSTYTAEHSQGLMAAPSGRGVILAGSCSAATRGQIEAAITAGAPAKAVDVLALAEGRQTAADLIRWVVGQDAAAMPLLYSSAGPDALARMHRLLGREASGALIETTLAQVARDLSVAGFTRFVIAGGETSGAVTEALGIKALAIGPEIAPGVPWTRCISGPDVVLALKSGNFGSPDFFAKAFAMLESAAP